MRLRPLQLPLHEAPLSVLKQLTVSIRPCYESSQDIIGIHQPTTNTYTQEVGSLYDLMGGIFQPLDNMNITTLRK